MISKKHLIRAVFAVAATACAGALHVGTAAAAAVETDIHDFPPANMPGSSNGVYFSSFIAGPGGALYGAALGYDPNSAVDGVVFRLTPPSGSATAWTFTDLHDFPNTAGLSAGLVTDGTGVLYGVTTGINGGGTGSGSVFRLTPPKAGQTSWTYEDLYRPSASGIGAYPESVTIAGGSLYGIGVCGQTTCVFGLTPPGPGQSGWQPSFVHAIASENFFSPLIAREVGGVVTLFGEGNGYAQLQDGYVFMLTAPKTASEPWTYTTLHTFQGPDGLTPFGGLIADRSLNLYGVTQFGGPTYGSSGAGYFGSGVVFRLSPPPTGQSAWSFSVLYAFSGSPNGASPNGALVAYNGSLYGITETGGVGCNSAVGCSGTLFKITPRDYGGHTLPWNESVVFDYLPNLASPGDGLLLAGSNPASLTFYGFAGGYRTNAVGFAYQLKLTP